jgi:GxxExxY protein
MRGASAGSRRREPDEELDQLARAVVGGALEVHRMLGPAYAEVVYAEALAVELKLREIPVQREATATIKYKCYVVGEGRVDMLIAGRLIVELKAVENLAPIHFSQILSYLRAFDCQLGLLINFNTTELRRGIKRFVLSKP